MISALSETKKIVVVEDDEKLAHLIKVYLTQHDYLVDVIGEGIDAVDAILSTPSDVVILDLMLPGKDGLTICREIRPHYYGRILFLTASEDAMDHVAGVEMGADDFLVKPVQPRVLLAHIRMLQRRHDNYTGVNGKESTWIRDSNNPAEHINERVYGQLTISLARRQTILSEQQIPLTTSEFDLLWLLASRPEEILSRDFIYRELRGIEYDGLDRSVDTKIGQLRKKLGDNPSMSTRIITVRGQGYLFVPDGWN